MLTARVTKVVSGQTNATGSVRAPGLTVASTSASGKMARRTDLVAWSPQRAQSSTIHGAKANELPRIAMVLLWKGRSPSRRTKKSKRGNLLVRLSKGCSKNSKITRTGSYEPKNLYKVPQILMVKSPDRLYSAK